MFDFFFFLFVYKLKSTYILNFIFSVNFRMIRREYLENIVNVITNRVIAILVLFVLAEAFVSVEFVDVIKDGQNRIAHVALIIMLVFLRME